MLCYGSGCPELTLLYACMLPGEHSYEDGVIITDKLYAVFDSATGVYPTLSAYWLVSRIIRYTNALILMPTVYLKQIT